MSRLSLVEAEGMLQKAYHDPAIAFTFSAPRFMFAHRF